MRVTNKSNCSPVIGDDSEAVLVILAIPSLVRAGAEKFVVQLASGLNREEYRAVVLVTRGHAEPEIIDALKAVGVAVIKTSSRSLIRSVLKSNYMILRLRPNVVHTNLSSVLHVALGVLLCRGMTARIHTVHSMAGFGEGRLKRRLMRVALKISNFTPVAISATVRDSIIATYRFQAASIPVIHNGVALQTFRPAAPAPQMQVGPVQLVAIGNLKQVKNHECLLRAFALAITATDLELALRIVGGGPLRGNLCSLAEELGIADAVMFIGQQDDVRPYLAEGDVFVSSSDVEGLPLALLEAMACGLPVVATGAGGVIDVVRDGKDGYIVPIGDEHALAEGLLQLVGDVGLRRRMGVSARERAEDFSMETCVQGYEDLYAKG